MDAILEQLRYPIGKYTAPDVISEKTIEAWMEEVEAFPKKLAKLVKPLSKQQMENTYRPGGWTVRQVVHHLADSHVNCYIRYKWTLTEDKPTIKAYFEDRWAELPDSQEPVKVSLKLLKATHARWVVLMRTMRPEDWSRSFIHPETGKERFLNEILGMYVWHGNHHFAHIQNAIK